MIEELLDMASLEAHNGVLLGDGGPFGAVITDKDGNIISKGHNMVLKSNDPTNHAEVVAIREACKRLNTHDLSGCIIYSSCEPCPMCLSAIIWANIDKVYYGARSMDAKRCGFRDDLIYDYIKGNNTIIDKEYVERGKAIDLLDNYKGEMY